MGETKINEEAQAQAQIDRAKIDGANKMVYEIRLAAYEIMDLAKYAILIAELYDSKLDAATRIAPQYAINKDELVTVLELLIRFLSQIEKLAYSTLNKARSAKCELQPISVD